MSIFVNRRQAVVAAACACAFTSARAAAAIMVGRSLPLSGTPLSIYAEQRQQGASLVLDAVNAAGGLAGRPIELVTLDDGYAPERMADNVRKFDEEHKAVALFGFLGPPVSANFNLLQELRIPLIAATTTASLRNPPQKYIFPMRAGFAEEAQAIVRHLMTVNVRNIAVLEHEQPLGILGARSFVAALQAAGINPAVVKMPAKDGHPALAAHQLKAINPAAILVAAGAPFAAAVVREIHKIGRPPAMFSFAAINTSALMQELGELAEGFGITQVVPNPTSTAQLVSREYQAAVAAANAKGLSMASTYYGIEGYLEARLLVEGLRRAARAGRVTRESVFQAFDQMGDVNLSGYRVRYSGGARQGSAYVDLTYVSTKGKVRS